MERWGNARAAAFWEARTPGKRPTADDSNAQNHVLKSFIKDKYQVCRRRVSIFGRGGENTCGRGEWLIWCVELDDFCVVSGCSDESHLPA
jgi:hypothetical protein